jgi:spermidine synthase
VVDTLEAVIGWHRRHLVPLGADVADDPRCTLVHGDFFALVAAEELLGPTERVHAVLVDIDHSPDHLLHPSHASLYTAEGLTRLARTLHPGGVFALWSNDPPDELFLDVVGSVFDSATAEVISFANFVIGADSTSTIYVART